MARRRKCVYRRKKRVRRCKYGKRKGTKKCRKTPRRRRSRGLLGLGIFGL